MCCCWRSQIHFNLFRNSFSLLIAACFISCAALNSDKIYDFIVILGVESESLSVHLESIYYLLRSLHWINLNVMLGRERHFTGSNSGNIAHSISSSSWLTTMRWKQKYPISGNMNIKRPSSAVQTNDVRKEIVITFCCEASNTLTLFMTACWKQKATWNRSASNASLVYRNEMEGMQSKDSLSAFENDFNSNSLKVLMEHDRC